MPRNGKLVRISLVIAAVVVSIYTAANNRPDRQASSGMSAFGDSILFLGVFGFADSFCMGCLLNPRRET